MSRNKFLMAWVFVCACPFQLLQAQRPNIIFIFSDDHDQRTISAYSNALMQTPNIDRLAKEGVVFANSFCTNSLCAPSRAVILTGKHCHLNGMRDNQAASIFDTSQVTFPRLLQASGYQTALVGKWHLKSKPMGFDYWEIHHDQGEYYNPVFISANGRRIVKGYATDIVTDLAMEWLDNRRDASRPFLLMVQNKAPHTPFYPAPRHLSLFENEKIPEPASLYDDYSQSNSPRKEQEMTIADHLSPAGEVKMDISTSRKYPMAGRDIERDNYYDTLEINRMDPSEKALWVGERKKRGMDFEQKQPMTRKELIAWKYQYYIKDYMRCVQAIDENVGRLMDYLQQKGLMENTIIIYAADQGFWLGDRGWYDKRWMYETSMRMPLIIRWPGVTKGTVNTSLVQNIDYAPTFLEMAGLKPLQEMQGISLVPLLKTGNMPVKRESLYYQYYEYPKPHRVQPHYGIRTERYKLIYFPMVKQYELYDLVEDPNETRSLAEDLRSVDLLATLKKQLEEERKKYKVVD